MRIRIKLTPHIFCHVCVTSEWIGNVKLSLKDTLIILQCCKSKKLTELYPERNYDLLEHLPETGHILSQITEQFKKEVIIDASSNRVTSISLYDGRAHSR